MIKAWLGGRYREEADTMIIAQRLHWFIRVHFIFSVFSLILKIRPFYADGMNAAANRINFI